MLALVSQAFDALQGFFEGSSDAQALVFFPSTLLFIAVAAMAFFGQKWRLGVVALPLAAWFFCMIAFTFGISRILIGAVLLSVAIVEAVLFLGPFRVSAWAWPGGVKPRTPRKVFAALLALAAMVGMGTAIVSYFCGYLLVFGARTYGINGIYRIDPWDFNGGMVFGQLCFGLSFASLLYFTFWGLYTAGLSCFSLRRQDCQARLADCGALVWFEGDPNGYRTSPSLRKRLQGHVGEAYMYTLVTTFNGRQFIRRPPKRAGG